MNRVVWGITRLTRYRSSHCALWDGVLSITSCNGKDVTAAYPELHDRPPTMAGREGVFDGEVVAIDESAPVQPSTVAPAHECDEPVLGDPACHARFFVVFDVVWLAPMALAGPPRQSLQFPERPDRAVNLRECVMSEAVQVDDPYLR
jgi:hypothetical protein